MANGVLETSQHLNGHAPEEDDYENDTFEKEDLGEEPSSTDTTDSSTDDTYSSTSTEDAEQDDIIEIPAVPSWMRELEAEETIIHLKEAIRDPTTSAVDKVQFSLSKAMDIVNMDPGADRSIKLMSVLLDVIDLAMEQNTAAILKLNKLDLQ